MTMPAYFTSLVRTIVPIIAGWLLALPIAHPLLSMFGADATQKLYALIAAVLAGIYYAVSRLIEEKFPKLGWLLGKPARPSYVDVPPTPAGVLSAVDLAIQSGAKILDEGGGVVFDPLAKTN